jgi:hypothetical protein
MEVKKEIINATINGTKGKTSTPDSGKIMIAPLFIAFRISENNKFPQDYAGF